MLTALQIAAFRIHGYCFWYLPGYIVEWDPKYEILKVVKSRFRWAVWLAFTINALLIAVGDFYVIFSHIYVEKRPFLRATHIFIFITGGCFVLISITITIILLHQRHKVTIGSNALFSVQYMLMKKYKPKSFDENGRYQNAGEQDYIGMLMCIVGFSLASSPLLVVVAVIFEHWDCTAFIMEDILPDAKYRDIRTTYMTIVVRFIVVAPSVIEVLRALSYYILQGIVFLNCLLKSLFCLANRIRSTKEYAQYYTYFMIAYGCIEEMANNMMCLIVTIDYWATIWAIWFCIQGWEKISPVMYYCLLIGTIMALVLSGIALPKIKVISEVIDGMMEKHTIRAKLWHIKWKTRKVRSVLARIKSLRKLTMCYGPFHPFAEDYVMEYFSGLAEKVIDFVLMIEL